MPLFSKITVSKLVDVEIRVKHNTHFKNKTKQNKKNKIKYLDGNFRLNRN